VLPSGRASRGGIGHVERLKRRARSVKRAHADVPVADIVATFAREYPRLMESSTPVPDTQFRKEAEETA